MGAYQACRDAGLAVPEDISVVSFDDSDLAGWLQPQLTSVADPAFRDGSPSRRDPAVRAPAAGGSSGPDDAARAGSIGAPQPTPSAEPALRAGRIGGTATAG